MLAEKPVSDLGIEPRTHWVAGNIVNHYPGASRPMATCSRLALLVLVTGWE
jgi:hypothetical protein